MKKQYTVVDFGGFLNGGVVVEANTSKEAALTALYMRLGKKVNAKIKKFEDIPVIINRKDIFCVSLLGGVRESVTYYKLKI